MLSSQEIKTALKELEQEIGDSVQVDVSDSGPEFVVAVTSEGFSTQDEAQRQRTVWKKLERKFSLDDLAQIEFVFTYTPEERAAFVAS